MNNQPRSGKSLRALQEDLTIAVLRRPNLGRAVKLTDMHEGHLPQELRPAFNIAVTKTQDEIRRLVLAQDARVWPLYGKRIVEWNEAQARAAARQIMQSVGRTQDHALTHKSICPGDGFGTGSNTPTSDAKQAENQSVFAKTLAAIQNIMAEREEITSRVIVDELIRIEGGPWTAWGKGRSKKPITQNALARLLKPYNIPPVDVGPAQGRRKGYKRVQFEGLFARHLGTQPRSRAGGD